MKKIIYLLLATTPTLFGFQDTNPASLHPAAYIPLKSEQEKSYHITGKVTDENGDGLPGVNVVLKTTTTGTTTDANGNYAIEVDNQFQTLVYSFVGYQTQEQLIGSRTVINVKLLPDPVE